MAKMKMRPPRASESPSVFAFALKGWVSTYQSSWYGATTAAPRVTSTTHSGQANRAAIVGSSHRSFDPVALPLLSQHHSKALLSPKCYGKRYEVEWWAYFGEFHTFRTFVNKDKKKRQSS
jgi:hypothetical protein